MLTVLSNYEYIDPLRKKKNYKPLIGILYGSSCLVIGIADTDTLTDEDPCQGGFMWEYLKYAGLREYLPRREEPFFLTG